MDESVPADSSNFWNCVLFVRPMIVIGTAVVEHYLAYRAATRGSKPLDRNTKPG
jgi:hypothetical protein